MVTFGVSTERGTVHAVALSDDDGKLPDRLLIRRTFHIGDAKSDLVPAIEAALEALADEIGPDHEIAGAAVTYSRSDRAAGGRHGPGLGSVAHGVIGLGQVRPPGPGRGDAVDGRIRSSAGL